jgi:hypothetical protein
VVATAVVVVAAVVVATVVAAAVVVVATAIVVVAAAVVVVAAVVVAAVVGVSVLPHALSTNISVSNIANKAAGYLLPVPDFLTTYMFSLLLCLVASGNNFSTYA